MASAKCECLPWDFFLSNRAYSECDIFGRTCFFAEYDNLTHFSGNICPHCIKECNKMEYHWTIIKQQKLMKKDSRLCSSYICYKQGKGLSGKKEFLEYLFDQDNATMELNLKNIIAGSKNITDQLKDKIRSMNKNLIIVKLEYQSSTVDVTTLDVRYSLSDKIANFGGTFGIWAELTGFSLLGIINVFVIVFKMLYKSIKKDHSSQK